MAADSANRHHAWLQECRRTGRAPFPLAEAWGIRFVDLGPGRAVVEMDVDAAHHNPVGLVHGGVLFMLLDSAFGYAATSVLDGPTRAGTVDVTVNFLRAVTRGTVRAEARVVRRGRSLIHLEASVHEGDRLVAQALGTAAVMADA